MAWDWPLSSSVHALSLYQHVVPLLRPVWAPPTSLQHPAVCDRDHIPGPVTPTEAVGEAVVADFGAFRPVASNTAVSLQLGSRPPARADTFGSYAPTRDPFVAARWPNPHWLGAIQCNMCGDTNTV